VEKTSSQGASWFVLLDKYNQSDQVEEDEIVVACSMNGEKRNALLVGEPERRRALGRPRRSKLV
jgi:hypothetical protein